MKFLLRRLTGFALAAAVAVCPMLPVVCAERCAHVAERSPATSHSHHRVDGQDAHRLIATASSHVHAQAADADVSGTESCHHPSAVQSQEASDGLAAIAASPASTQSSHVAPTCSQCMGDALVLLAARAGDDGSRTYNGGSVLHASLAGRLLLSNDHQINAVSAVVRLKPPAAPPTWSPVLRI